MSKLIFVALCAGLMGSAMAAGDANLERAKSVAGKSEPAAQESAATASGNSPATSPATSASTLVKPSDNPVTSAPQANQPASAVSVAPQPGNATENPSPQANPPVSKSSIPLDKRQGGDVTKCLELGSAHEIAACADKHR